MLGNQQRTWCYFMMRIQSHFCEQYLHPLFLQLVGCQKDKQEFAISGMQMLYRLPQGKNIISETNFQLPLKEHLSFLLFLCHLLIRALQRSQFIAYPQPSLDLPSGLCSTGHHLKHYIHNIPLKHKDDSQGSPPFCSQWSIVFWWRGKRTTSIYWKFFQITLILLKRRQAIFSAVIGESVPPKCRPLF